MFDTTAKQYDYIVTYHNNVITLKSGIETINNSINKSISIYRLDNLNVNSLQTTIEKFRSESNEIINSLSNAVNSCNSSHHRDDNIQHQLVLLNRDRNLVRDEYLEMQKERMAQTVEQNHLMTTLKADQMELSDMFETFKP